MPEFNRIDAVSRHWDLGDDFAFIRFVPRECTLFDEANDADEVVALADWILNRDAVGAETSQDRLKGELPICAGLVHLVDEAHARNVVPLCLSPHGFRLRFHAFLTVEDCNSAVEHAK